ncbi:MAG: hypothetical protein LUG12_11630 [Erysipelotrichaceae bacterium]|nr:hypothetical protein [Erysipelotrichaceae bacterium]
MYIYEFLKALKLYPIDFTRYPNNAFYLGIYTIDEIIQKDIKHSKDHQYYLVYFLQQKDKLYSIDIDKEMDMIRQYNDYILILPHKSTIYLDEAMIEAMRLYDELVSNFAFQWSTAIFASMLHNRKTSQKPTLSYFYYNPIIYQMAYARFVYFIKMYCYYRLRKNRRGYPVRHFEEHLKNMILMYIQKDCHTYHIYQLTNYENNEFDLFLSQISKNKI